MLQLKLLYPSSFTVGDLASFDTVSSSNFGIVRLLSNEVIRVLRKHKSIPRSYQSR